MGEALALAAQGAGRPVLIRGPPGIGKTRLAQAAVEKRLWPAPDRSARDRAQRGFPFGLVRQLFEPALNGSGPERTEALFGAAAGPAIAVFSASRQLRCRATGSAVWNTCTGFTGSRRTSPGGPGGPGDRRCSLVHQASLRFLPRSSPRRPAAAAFAFVAVWGVRDRAWTSQRELTDIRTCCWSTRRRSASPRSRASWATGSATSGRRHARHRLLLRQRWQSLPRHRSFNQLRRASRPANAQRRRRGPDRPGARRGLRLFAYSPGATPRALLRRSRCSATMRSQRHVAELAGLDSDRVG